MAPYYLVVAHQTVTSPELLKAVRGVREQDAEAEFVLLVPATQVRHLLFRKGDEHDAEATARKRGERARAVFTKKGVPLSEVRVGAADPGDAIDQEVAAHPGYAGFVISTPAGGEVCGWICPARSGRSTGCPCTTSSPRHRPTWGHGSEPTPPPRS